MRVFNGGKGNLGDLYEIDAQLDRYQQGHQSSLVSKGQGVLCVMGRVGVRKGTRRNPIRKSTQEKYHTFSKRCDFNNIPNPPASGLTPRAE